MEEKKIFEVQIISSKIPHAEELICRILPHTCDCPIYSAFIYLKVLDVDLRVTKLGHLLHSVIKYVVIQPIDNF